MQYISTFFRNNLKRPEQNATLGEEIEHINAYLQIEKARFQENLQIHLDIPDEVKQVELPAFTLQPIVENAIKHGTSQLLNTGYITIRSYIRSEHVYIEIEDNAGLYQPSGQSDGLGMGLVDKRLRLKYGEKYGIGVEYEPEKFTRVKIRLPYMST